MLWPGVFVALLLAESPSGVVDVGSQIRNRCEVKWPNNYAMQDHCTNGQLDAYEKVTNMMKRMGYAEREILSRCFAKWADGDARGLDWPMVLYCYNRRIGVREQIE